MKNRPFSLYIIYIWLGLFCFLPLGLVFIASFLSKDPIYLVSLPFTLDNYKALISPLFLNVFFRSLTLAIITTFLCLLLAYPFSYLLIRSKHQSMLILLIIIPFWTSSLIRTYSLMAILKFRGLLNAVLLKFHIIDTPLSLLYSNFAVLIGLVYNLFPFMVLPIITNMERFDFRLIEAARDLGANKWTVFSKIFLPNTINGIVSGCLMVLLPAMTLFYIPAVLGGARSVLLGNMIQDQFLVLEDWPQGSATSVLLTLILLLLLAIFRRQNSEVMH
ncbi:spermidine/putrescine ABC transporter permease PotB [Legionella israelensis]|uniref:Spermidine/putrescine ABC transporter permease PotB n=1 Tax=Legionella israelensis TaxID=454 RepID=A0AAX1EH49_9GAMM|nr:spermidine/putrescine ABC transporter permease PotB [Legionella israelensis]QBR84426.1 spermidine/putrescine ABC transporter permease PotB [Legionella israelensis]QDP72465.1 spermidine/putrescine ABC transporter permease PotB [Legionella israelensis]